MAEVIGTSALKYSDGFTKVFPSAIVVIGYGIAFYFLSITLKSIPIGRVLLLSIRLTCETWVI